MVIAEGRHGGDLGRYLLDGDAVGVVIEMAGEAQAMTIRRRVGLRVVMTTGERKYSHPCGTKLCKLHITGEKKLFNRPCLAATPLRCHTASSLLQALAGHVQLK